jgi:hypothetical protein
MPANANASPDASLWSVACPKVGWCAAVRQYRDKSGGTRGVAVAESAGAWRAGTEVRPRLSGSREAAVLTSVTCPRVGACVAAGRVSYLPVVATQSDGSWARAVRVTALPSNASHSPLPFLDSVGCVQPGTCVAVGGYATKADGQAIMVATESGGRLTRVREVLPPPNSGKGLYLLGAARAVSCTPSGSCVLVGTYVDTAQSLQGMAVRIQLR